MAHNLDHSTYSYIAVTFSASSPFIGSPNTLSARHPTLGLNYVGQVGQLLDTHLYSVLNSELQRRGVQAETIAARDIQGRDGVIHVEVQKPSQRARRGGDEF
ncbi:hypothetical protein CPB83DRAFT_894521 [Crepidotus variabilis]|uniref:Uncharacterized protein n=1 Tax=Crepidotus variabilis TaxID=179855 RepID=A0A9P6EFT3_9AGAR|nr:hypothetical protein CPB83DRAFT_894521 [Crepidotus variabilis]